MPIVDSILPEFDQEMKITRTLLERVPEDRPDWKPHAKSTALGQLATHIARLPTFATTIVSTPEFDMVASGAPPTPAFVSTAELVSRFDDNVRTARRALAGASDDEMRTMWTFRAGERTIASLPRMGMLRVLCLNHMIHHRGQLSVYLRLNDVPLPSIYGPSADTPR